MKETLIAGKVWLLLDGSGNLIEDIDTDQIYHNAFLHITDIEQMGQYALGNLEGWKDFPRKASPGDILVAGRNFGAGSSRQQAVDCFASLGIGSIIAAALVCYRQGLTPALGSGSAEGVIFRTILGHVFCESVPDV